MRKGRDGEKREKRRGKKRGKKKKKEKTDENSGHYIISSSRPPERRPLERHTLAPIYPFSLHPSLHMIQFHAGK